MSASREVFLKDKDLVKWWISVTHDPRWLSIVTFGRAEIMEIRPTQDQMVGSELLIHTLANLAESDDKPFDFPNPGLHHMAEKSRPKPKQKE